MATVFELSGFDKLYDETKIGKLIVNDIDGMDRESKEMLDNLLTRSYTEDSISMVPQCNCGSVKGTLYVGAKCESCKTMVSSTIGEDLNYLVWVKQPKGVAKLISPFVMLILLERYKITSPAVSLVKYIIQTSLRPKARNSRNMDKLGKLDFILSNNNISRGYNSFVENFEKIITLLEHNFTPSNTPKKAKQEFLDWILSEQKNFMSSYVPVPNRSLFVFDTNENGKFADKEAQDIVQGINRMTGIDLKATSSMAKQNATANFLCDFAKYYRDMLTEKMFGKPGLIRKNISRTRSHFTVRAVVTSNAKRHRKREIHLPWSAACSVFREHILKGLQQRGYSYKASLNLFMNHIEYYSPIIDEIFHEIIQQAGTDEYSGVTGFPCLLNRNPSLDRGSIQYVRISKVKTDPDDNSMTVSYLLSPVFNMDFDGDMLNLTLLFTKQQIQEAMNFAFHHNILGMKGPDEFGDALKFPKSVISMFSNWMEGSFYLKDSEENGRFGIVKEN